LKKKREKRKRKEKIEIEGREGHVSIPSHSDFLSRERGVKSGVGEGGEGNWEKILGLSNKRWR